MKEIRKLYLFTFFRSFTVFASISVAFYKGNGLSYFEIMLLQSLYAVATAVMEIPSGMLSDMLGRKRTLIMGTVSFIIAYSFGAIGTSLLPFALMQIFAAIGQSCYSGTFLALMYEDMNADTSINKSTNVIFANLQMINLVSALSASILSVFVVKYISMRAAYVITVFMYVVTFLINLMLYEKKETAGMKRNYSVKAYASIFTDSVNAISTSGFRYLFIDMILFACFANTLLYVEQPLLLDRNFPIAYFGVVTVIISVATTTALKFVGFIEKRMKSLDKALKIFTIVVIIMLLSNVFLRNAGWVILTFVVLTIAVRIREIFIMTDINKALSDDTRATVMSIVSAIEMIGMAVFSAVIGYCEDISVDFSLIVISATMLMSYAFLWTKKRLD